VLVGLELRGSPMLVRSSPALSWWRSSQARKSPAVAKNVASMELER